MPFTAFPIPSAELSTVAADARAAISAAQAIQIVTTSTLQAVRGGRYIIEYAGQCEISDPTGSNAAGDSYEVWIGGSGSTARFGGAGTVYSPSRFSIRRRCSVAGSPGTWAIPAPMLTDTLTVGAGTWSGSTISGAQTFSGQVQLSASQAASNTQSAMSLGLSDSRYLSGRGFSDEINNTWFPELAGWTLTGGTSTAQSYPSHLKLVTSAATSSTVRATTALTTDAYPMLGGYDDGIDFSKEVWAIFRFSIVANHATWVCRGSFGRADAPIGDLDRAGFGFEVDNLSLKLTTHDGTSFAKSGSSQATLTAGTPYTLLIKKATNGVITGTLNGVALPNSLSGGPTSLVNDLGCAFLISGSNGATATAGRFYVSRLGARIIP